MSDQNGENDFVDDSTVETDSDRLLDRVCVVSTVDVAVDDRDLEFEPETETFNVVVLVPDDDWV